MTALLSVRDLEVRFSVRGRGLFARARPLAAVDRVSFDAMAGETLGIVGESGCGKSSLARAILRLVPAQAGAIVFMGSDLRALDEAAVWPFRRDMQIVFQDPLASLDPRMTIGDIIAEPLEAFEPKLSREEVRARVGEMLAKVGLSPDMLNRYPHEFSGGQCQRIGIARAVIIRPKLVACDEPVSSLDVSVRAQIVNLLMALQRELELTLLFISHDLTLVRHVSHRVLVLYLGRVVEIAPSARLFEAPRHPYTQALMAAALTPDPRRERAKPRLALLGEPPSPLDLPTGCAFRTRCPKASARCAAEEPRLADDGVNGTWQVACHHWREVP